MAKKHQAKATPPSGQQAESIPFIILERQPSESDAEWAEVIRNLEASDQLNVLHIGHDTIGLVRIHSKMEAAA